MDYSFFVRGFIHTSTTKNGNKVTTGQENGEWWMTRGRITVSAESPSDLIEVAEQLGW